MEKRFLWQGIVLTLIVHGVFFAVLSFSGSPSPFCNGGIRCQTKPMVMARRLPEFSDANIEVLEASIIPRLGYAKPNPRKYPKLVKYEQPERQEVAVNIKKKNKKTKVLPKAEKHKKAQLDRRRKRKTLSEILGEPEDNDRRKRPTALDRIVGSPNGSIYSDSAVSRKGNIYAARVALRIRRVFKTPPLISPGVLRHLKVRILVTKIDESGHIISFKVVKGSGNPSFDRAAKAAVAKFVPSMGGTMTLPRPDPQTLQFINKKGMVIDLEGKGLM